MEIFHTTHTEAWISASSHTAELRPGAGPGTRHGHWPPVPSEHRQHCCRTDEEVHFYFNLSEFKCK